MVDRVNIKIKAGNGGDGLVHFHRERFLPKGGPDGGDGGKGGDIYIVSDSNLLSLYDFRSQRNFKAEDGRKGGAKNSFGKSGEDLVIKVPIGTTVYKLEGEESEGKELIVDIEKPNEKVLIAVGGKGGKGNFRFKSSVNQKPMQFTKGEEGQELYVGLELRFIADVGLVGLPNSGKSSLLNVLTNARVKVADYPFTTLEPNLGSLMVENQKIIIADIPGIIEGASTGKGLGFEFLRQIERTKILVFVIDVSFKKHDFLEIKKEINLINAELQTWNKELLNKKQIVVLNKIDLLSNDELNLLTNKDFIKEKVLLISTKTGEGLQKLKEALALNVRELPKVDIVQESKKLPKTFFLEDLKNKAIVFK